MTCQHNLEFDSIYTVNTYGACDNCGSPHNLDNLWLLYQGDLKGVHQFYVLSPFCCLGCRLEVKVHYCYCGGLDVTNEMRTIKKEETP